MGIYICENCDNFVDDDEEPGSEYGTGLVCPNCVEDLLNEVDKIFSKEKLASLGYDKMSEEEQLEWARNNL